MSSLAEPRIVVGILQNICDLQCKCFEYCHLIYQFYVLKFTLDHLEEFYKKEEKFKIIYEFY